MCVYRERKEIDQCLDLNVETKELAGIWVCVAGSDPRRQVEPLGSEPEVFLPPTSHPAKLQESAGKGAASWPACPGPGYRGSFTEGAVRSLSLKLAEYKGQILGREPDRMSQGQLAMKSVNASRLAHRGWFLVSESPGFLSCLSSYQPKPAKDDHRPPTLQHDHYLVGRTSSSGHRALKRRLNSCLFSFFPLNGEKILINPGVRVTSGPNYSRIPRMRAPPATLGESGPQRFGKIHFPDSSSDSETSQTCTGKESRTGQAACRLPAFKPTEGQGQCFLGSKMQSGRPRLSKPGRRKASTLPEPCNH
ncbi:uncharacterized protein PS065_016510 [Dugong dugon]